MKSESIDLKAEDIVSELDPDYVDCLFGIRVKPEECTYYNLRCICIDCKHPRVDQALSKTLLE